MNHQEDIDINHHWILQLEGNKNHSLWSVLRDFYPNGRKFLDSCYLHLASLGSRRKNQHVKLAILHYHSYLEGSYKFGDLQNLRGYKDIKGIRDSDIIRLGCNVTSKNVIDLSNPNISSSILKGLDASDILVTVNEKAETKHYKNFRDDQPEISPILSLNKNKKGK